MKDDEISYNDFRTGLTFNDVRQILKHESKVKYSKGEYMFVTRHTVLGRWHQIKKQMYKEYLDYVFYKMKE